MKFRLIAICIASISLLLIAPVAAQAWKQVPGSGIDLSISPKGMVYVVGSMGAPGGKALYKWTGMGWVPMEGGGLCLSAGPSEQLWLVNDSAKIYRNNGGGWEEIDGLATHISVAPDDGSVWIVGNTRCGNSGNVIYHREGNDWMLVDGCAVKIAAGPNRTVYSINRAGNIFSNQGHGWTQMPGSARDIAVSANGDLWVIGTDNCGSGGSLFKWNGNDWLKREGCGLALALDREGNPWILNSYGQIWKPDVTVAKGLLSVDQDTLANAKCVSPLTGNSGKIMCPYTSDDVLADWVDKGINVRAGSTVGKVVGATAGAVAGGMVAEHVLGQIPFVGGILGAVAGAAIGKAAGGAVGHEAAVESIGGWDYIRETSDLSFNSIDDMIVYIYVKHSKDANFGDVVNAVSAIYPEFNDRLEPALKYAGLL